MQDWSEYAKALLRGEMVKRKISYAELGRRLGENGGEKVSEANLRNKVSRGSFTAAFLLECLSVMKVTTLHLETI